MAGIRARAAALTGDSGFMDRVRELLRAAPAGRVKEPRPATKRCHDVPVHGPLAAVRWPLRAESPSPTASTAARIPRRLHERSRSAHDSVDSEVAEQGPGAHRAVVPGQEPDLGGEAAVVRLGGLPAESVVDELV
jgi:hypothetical protein